MSITSRALLPAALFVVALALAPSARGQAANLRRALEEARAAAEAGNAAALDGALRGVIAAGGRPAVRGLLELAQNFPEGRDPLYWQVLGGLVSVTGRLELDTLADFLVRSGDEPLARDLMLALQANRSEEVLGIYQRLLRPRTGPLQTSAVDRLGELARADAVDLLLEILRREDGSGSLLERRIRSTLTALFGQDMGARVNFEGWWEQNRETAFTARGAQGGATGTVRDHLDEARQGALASMARRGGRVIVVRGSVRNFDEIEKMLEQLAVRHEVMTKDQFNEDPVAALDGSAALLLNCSFFGSVCRCPDCKPGVNPRSRLPVCTGCDVHKLVADRLSDESIERIKAWVLQGGCVFTEDYGLRELTGRAWPQWVRAGTDLSEGDVDYSPVPGQSDTSLLRGVLVQPGATATTTTERRPGRWKVDDLSPSIMVVDRERVQVLLASQELTSVMGGANAVAVAFAPGDVAERTEERRGRAPRRRAPESTTSGGHRSGIVLHVLSHFGKQKDQADEFTLQNLLVNFLVEAQERFDEKRASR